MTTLLTTDADWLTPEQVAKQLGRSDVGELIELGYIRSVMTADGYMIPADYLAEFQARYGGQ